MSHSDDNPGKVTQAQAEDAVRVLLEWAGEDPTREGLLDTPKRVAKAYRDWFSGYQMDPREYLARTFEEVAGYDEMIVLRDIEYESHCEHHMAPIIGKVHIGYLPAGKVVGISKLARVVEAYARRFQVQEKMTSQIANCILRALQPRGVGVVVEGAHECMTTRGIHKRGVSMVTSKMLGSFRDDARTRAEYCDSPENGGHCKAGGLKHNIGRLPAGNFDQTLLGVKARLNFSPDLQINSFIQFDNESRSIGTNTRVRWTFHPQGDLFVIYNHNIRDFKESPAGWARDANGLLVKIQYAWRR